jgi:hypothetical protein
MMRYSVWAALRAGKQTQPGTQHIRSTGVRAGAELFERRKLKE